MSGFNRELHGDDIVCLNFDGLCEPKNPGGIATYGVIIRKGKAVLLRESGLAFADPWSSGASNNVAEYSGLIRGLEWLKDQGMLDAMLIIRGDSNLVINQLNGTFKVKAVRIVELFKRARELIEEFCNLKIEWVERSQNKEADLLSRIAYSRMRKKYPSTVS